MISFFLGFRMRTEIGAKRRYFLPSPDKTTTTMELKIKDLSMELCEKLSTKLPINTRLELYANFVKALSSGSN